MVVRFDTRVTFIKMGHVDNVRVANYASLPASNIGAPTPTGKVNIVVTLTDGGSFCNCDELGRPMVAPTIKKDNRRLCGDDPYALGSSRAPTPTGEMYVICFGNGRRCNL